VRAEQDDGPVGRGRLDRLAITATWDPARSLEELCRRVGEVSYLTRLVNHAHIVSWRTDKTVLAAGRRTTVGGCRRRTAACGHARKETCLMDRETSARHADGWEYGRTMTADSGTRYTHGHAPSVLASHRRRTAANSAGYLLPHLTAGTSILDVGCGPGTITLDLARLVDGGRVVGVDASPEAIDIARLAAQGSGTEVSFEVDDVCGLRYGDGAFDVVHAHQLLHHVGDPVAALREMGRVCRPGGLVAVRDADYAGMTWSPSDPRLDRWSALFREQARRNGGEPDAGRRLLGWAHAAGFADVTATASVWCFASDEDRRWWGSTWAERVTESALAEQLIESGAADRRELALIAAAWREWAGHPDGFFTVPHGEALCRRGEL
jgi:2-polyprenyl-3-methyl-5-hydroxy-6-metoxy-1,4-benzoquinol methylase